MTVLTISPICWGSSGCCGWCCCCCCGCCCWGCCEKCCGCCRGGQGCWGTGGFCRAAVDTVSLGTILFIAAISKHFKSDCVSLTTKVPQEGCLNSIDSATDDGLSPMCANIRSVTDSKVLWISWKRRMEPRIWCAVVIQFQGNVNATL